MVSSLVAMTHPPPRFVLVLDLSDVIISSLFVIKHWSRDLVLVFSLKFSINSRYQSGLVRMNSISESGGFLVWVVSVIRFM